MPRLDGVAATARVIAAVPQARVLVLTTFDLDEYAFGALDAGASGELTPREKDVFFALARGLTNAEIARELFLSETTVKTHVGRVLAKLGARDRIQAVILAYSGGWGDDSPAGSQNGQSRPR